MAIALFGFAAGMGPEGGGWARPLLDTLYRHLTIEEFDAGQNLISTISRGRLPISVQVDAFLLREALDSAMFPVYRNPCDYVGFP